jgi:enediyne biosynthesis protein E5
MATQLTNANTIKQKQEPAIVTLNFYPNKDARRRTFALWYFGVLMIVLNVFGHTVLGFEQSWITPFIAVGSACAAQLVLELVDCWANNRNPRLGSNPFEVASFFLPSMITGFACAMLLFPNEHLMPIVFAAVLSIASKLLFRAPVGNRTQHFFNPSNFGITITLLLFPFVGVSPPYHFTENVTGVWDWVVPGVILFTGILIHAFCTGRLPLVLAWLGGFVLQAVARHLIFGVPLLVPLVPMTSAAFILFTLYMIPDPATTPIKIPGQIAFGLAVALIYGLSQAMHMVFGLFLVLTFVSLVRGVALTIMAAHSRNRELEAAPENASKRASEASVAR